MSRRHRLKSRRDGRSLDGCQFDDRPRKTDWEQKQLYSLNVFFRQVERVGKPPDLGLDPQAAAPLRLHDNSGYNVKGIIFYEKRNGSHIEN